jgi:hypothetical protein
VLAYPKRCRATPDHNQDAPMHYLEGNTEDVVKSNGLLPGLF